MSTAVPPLARIVLSGSGPESVSVQAMVRLLEESGSRVTIVMERDPLLAEVQLAEADGLVLMGNNYDIDPADYGAACHAATCVPDRNGDAASQAAHLRAEHEKALVTEALRRKLPLLGVCGGMQRINVTLGGTLHQHIPDMLDHAAHLQKADVTPFHIPVQFVRIEENSLLGGMARPSAIAMPAHGTTEGLLLAENSIHHQAVDQLANGLKANARSIESDAQNDIVEGFEVDPEGPLADQMILGFQFHPEFKASDMGTKLAEFFSEAALAYAESKRKQQEFDARIVVEAIKAKTASAKMGLDSLTTIAKADITLGVLHALGVFHNMEELRNIPVAKIQAALSSAHLKTAQPPRPPPAVKGPAR